jgi:hypothetical protein
LQALFIVMTMLILWKKRSIVIGALLLATFQTLLTADIQQQSWDDWWFPAQESATVDAPPFTWSACMIAKDENIGLPEWLAYHMQLLPLKRFIIGLDPSGKTNPRHILKGFGEIGLDWTVLEYGDYFREGRKDYCKRNFTHRYDRKIRSMVPVTDKLVLYKSHLWRQSVFYEKCLTMLREEKRTWTIFLDTDEFLTYNPYLPEERPSVLCVHGNREKVIQCLKKYHANMMGPEQGVHMRTLVPITLPNGTMVLPPSNTSRSVPATMAHFLHRYMQDIIAWHEDWKLPCWGLPRRNFGAFESNSTQTAQKEKQVLQTLRFRLHTQAPFNGLGKCMVDVSRYEGKFDVANPHRILPAGYCGHAPYTHSELALFRVHHYSTSLQTTLARGKSVEDFLSRQPPENTILQETFEATAWWPQLVKKVGLEKAQNLTNGFWQWAVQEYAQAYPHVPTDETNVSLNLASKYTILPAVQY